MLLHGGRPIPGGRDPVSAEIRHDQAIALRQQRSRGLPEFVIGGKRMQKDQGGAPALDLIKNLRVGAGQFPHAQASEKSTGKVNFCGYVCWSSRRAREAFWESLLAASTA